jgi:hypothetical protein
MKTDQVMLSERINQKIWARGIHKPPGKIKVKAIKDKDGIVKAMLPDEMLVLDKKKGKVEEKPKEESKEGEKPSKEEAVSEPPKEEKAEKPKEKE